MSEQVLTITDKFNFKCLQQLVYLFFGFFHIRHNILDMIRCAISAVSVIESINRLHNPGQSPRNIASYRQ